MVRERTFHPLLIVGVATTHPLAERYLEGLLRKESRFSLLPLNRLVRGHPDGLQPRMLVMDITVLARGIPTWLRCFRANFPRGRSVLIGPAITDEELATKMLMGIHGYLSYSQVERGLAQALFSVSRGELVLPGPAMQMYICASSRALAERKQRNSILTDREREVVELVLKRLSNKQVAGSLGLSESTVKFHLSRVFSKLEVTDRWALEEKIRREEEAYESHHWSGKVQPSGAVEMDELIRSPRTGTAQTLNPLSNLKTSIASNHLKE
jgi:DNA-binding NarL/FixJ family response regulator